MDRESSPASIYDGSYSAAGSFTSGAGSFGSDAGVSDPFGVSDVEDFGDFLLGTFDPVEGVGGLSRPKRCTKTSVNAAAVTTTPAPAPITPHFVASVGRILLQNPRRESFASSLVHSDLS